MGLREFPQYDSIPYAGDYECPECGSSKYIFGTKTPQLIGWCSTPRGYMMVFECQECFTKFRYHNTGSPIYDWKTFKEILNSKYINS